MKKMIVATALSVLIVTAAAGCSANQALVKATPSASGPAAAAVQTAPPATPAIAPPPAIAPIEKAVSYGSCAEVKAAGKAPLHAGDPGYSRKLDADGDGIACEQKK